MASHRDSVISEMCFASKGIYFAGGCVGEGVTCSGIVGMLFGRGVQCDPRI
jgi:hypothetical protein